MYVGLLIVTTAVVVLENNSPSILLSEGELDSHSPQSSAAAPVNDNPAGADLLSYI